MPYFSKEEAVKFINDTAKCLDTGGVFYISTMEDDYLKSTFKKGSSGDEIFMHYHEYAYLEHALLKSEFKVADTQRLQYTDANGTETTDLIIIAIKK